MQADLLDRLLVTLAVRLRSFSVCRIQRGWRLGFSPFEAITLHYVLQGTGAMRVGDGPWRTFEPRTIIVVPARLSHTLGEVEHCVGEARAEDHCVLHGDGLVSFTAGDGSPDALFVCGQISNSYSGALGLYELFQTPIIQPFPSNNMLQQSFELMLSEVAHPQLGTQAMTEALMKQCLVILLRQHLASTDGYSPLLAALQHPKLARAVLAILEEPGAAYSVESLAASVGMSRSSFTSQFSAVFDVGPMEFVQRVRLRVAARLLTGTDLPVKVVAASVGYASRSSFSKVFEAEFGVAPGQYRLVGSQDEGEPERVEDAAIGTTSEDLPVQ